MKKYKYVVVLVEYIPYEGEWSNDKGTYDTVEEAFKNKPKDQDGIRGPVRFIVEVREVS